MALQVIGESGVSEGAVTFANQKLWRIPAVVAAQIRDDELREGLDVLVNPVEVFVLGLAHGVAIAGAHRIDKYQIGFVQQALGVIHQFIGRGRRERPVNGVGAPGAEGAHVQPHSRRARPPVVQE